MPIPRFNLLQLLMAFAVAVLVLAACNTAGAPVDPGADDEDDVVETGSLFITVTGLPEEGMADVLVTGPNAYSVEANDSIGLTGLEPGSYSVAADPVTVGTDQYSPTVSGSPATVPAGDSASVTVIYLLDQDETGDGDGGGDTGGTTATEDGDSLVAPAVHALFRSTSGAPVWVDTPLFNEDDPIDAKGLQYRNDISEPGDESDTIQFAVVHGEVDTTLQVGLACAPAPGDTSTIRARIYVDGELVPGGTIICGETDKSVVLENTGGTVTYLLVIEPILSDPYYTAYVVSLDAFCFQQCSFEPYEDL